MKALIRIIEKSGAVPRSYFYTDDVSSKAKPDGSLVTRIDGKVEHILTKHIKKAFPEDSIMGEEQGLHESGKDYVWYIDPIDGTDNLIRRIPFFSISVARLGKEMEDSFGIVHNPVTKQTFYSAFDEGVYENKSVRSLRDEPLGKKMAISMGRGKKPEDKVLDYNLRKALALKFGKGSPLGSAALELSYLAAGRIDGYFSLDLKSWDIAAGLFIARAAGATVSELKEGAWLSLDNVSMRDICARENLYLFVSRPDIHADVLNFVQDFRNFRR